MFSTDNCFEISVPIPLLLHNLRLLPPTSSFILLICTRSICVILAVHFLTFAPRSYNWVYPRWNAVSELDDSIHMQDPSDISVPDILGYLRQVLKKRHMKTEESAIVLNYGLHFARSTSFEKYKKLILGVVEELKSYKGQLVWRTTTSVWKQHWKVHKRFQTNQVSYSVFKK